MIRIRSISLGLSYSLTDDDVFSFLAQLPELRTVELQYYPVGIYPFCQLHYSVLNAILSQQLKKPAAILRLTNLISFTVKYGQMDTRDEVNHFCSWIRRSVSSSRKLQSLRLICENEWSRANVTFDGLATHLVARHWATIRFLDLRSVFIRGSAFTQLCRSCIQLEEFSVAVHWDTLVSRLFIDY